MKIPVAMNARDIAKTEVGTPENEIVSTIAVAISAIVTTLVILVGVIMLVPLQPVLNAPALQPAFNNVVPALFGALGLKYFAKSPQIAVIPLLLMCALCLFVPSLVIMFSIMPRTCSKLVHFVFWLGGKLRIVKNPKASEFKVMKTVIQNAKCIKMLASKPLVFLNMLLLSFLEQFANVSIAFFTLKFFGFNIGVIGIREWLIVSQFCFILYASISFIPTPGNSGAADLSFYLLFNIGLIDGFSFPAMLVWRFISFYFHLLFGFIFTTYKKKSDHKKLANGQELE
jgi:uncharacterized protein (TIRG00374 family)